MEIRFNGFIIVTMEENINIGRVAVPTEISNKKPSGFVFRDKNKQIIQFGSISFYDSLMSTDIYDVIELIEFMKAFSSNKLMMNREYSSSFFEAKMTKKDDEMKLKIIFKKHYYEYYDKYSCNMIAAKLQKAISKCEPWQE